MEAVSADCGDVAVVVEADSVNTLDTESSSKSIAYAIFEKAMAFKDELGDFNLFGLATLNWREIPCILGIAIAIIGLVVTIFIQTVPATATLFMLMLGTSTSGLYYTQAYVFLRGLQQEIHNLKDQILRLELLQVKYEQNGRQYDISLQELREIENRLAAVKGQLETTSRHLLERADEYKILNQKYKDLNQRYSDLLDRHERMFVGQGKPKANAAKASAADAGS